jgi:hypothetical protein
LVAEVEGGIGFKLGDGGLVADVFPEGLVDVDAVLAYVSEGVLFWECRVISLRMLTFSFSREMASRCY